MNPRTLLMASVALASSIAAAAVDAADLAERLAARRIPALRLASRDDRLYVRTVAAPWAVVTTAVAALTAIGAHVLALPVLDGRSQRSVLNGAQGRPNGARGL